MGQSLAGDAKSRPMPDVHWKGGKDMKNVLRLSAVLVCLIASMVATEPVIALLENLSDYGTMVEKAHLVAIATPMGWEALSEGTHNCPRRSERK